MSWRDDPRFASEAPDAPPGPSAWQRLCPLHAWRDEVLERLEAEIDDPATAAELERLEDAEEYPAPVLARLRALGLAEIVAEGEGPSRVTMWHLCALNAIAARRNASLAITIGVNGLALIPVYLAATDAQRVRIFARVRGGASCALLLSELEHGSNLLRNQARAERVSSTHFRLEGEKHLINGATRHELLFALMRTRPGDGSSPLASRGDFTVFCAERDDTVEVLPRHRTLPATGADIAGARFRGTRVSADAVIGREGDGFGLIQKTLIVSRGGIGALASAAASRARDLAGAYARRRDIYGGPIAALGPIQDHLLRVEALDLLAAAVSLRATAAVNALGLAAAHFTAVAKHACCALAEEAVTEGRRVLSARALLRGHPYERLVRDVLLYGVFDGTSHLMLDQLQWRLAQAAAGVAVEKEGTVEWMRTLYATPPRRLIEAVRGPATPLLLAPSSHAAALASVAGRVDLAPLVDLAEGLLEAVRAIRSQGAWDCDAGLRFDAGEAFGGLESLFALVELADPDRRVALGLAPVDEPTYPFALAWQGARVASRSVAISERAADGAGVSRLRAAESAFLRAMASRSR